MKGRVRAFAPEDSTQVIALHERTLLEGRPTSTELRGFLDRLYPDAFLGNPWATAEIPSLVYERDDGDVVGFLGAIPRPMSYCGKPVRIAIASRFMVDHTQPRATLAAATLFRRFLEGSQDLSLVDNANEPARQIWRASRARMVPLFSVSWTASPDDVAEQDGENVSGRYLETPELLDIIHSVAASYELQPAYNETSLQWLLDLYASARYRGVFHRRAVTIGTAGTVIGSYLYYSNEIGYNGVVQVCAPVRLTERTVNNLLAHAQHTNVDRAVRGRCQPFLLDFVHRRGYRLGFGPWMLAHSANPGLLLALTSGNAFFTQLEGEF